MRWHKRRVEENGERWLDWVSEDGVWTIGEGHDEEARRAGRPWTLHRRVDGKLRWVDTTSTLAAAKSLAEKLAQEGGAAA